MGRERSSGGIAGLRARAKRLWRNVTQKNVIRKKLLLYFLITAIIVNSICLYTYNNTRLLINRLNGLFVSATMLTDLGNSVGAVETSISNYLTTSHSEDLEAYLNASNQLRKSTGTLNASLSTDVSELLLVDIKGMIMTYLGKTDAAEYSKRGRDINSYSESFNEASRIYSYINEYIEKLKLYEFQKNNANYLQLDRWLGMLQVFNIAVILVAMLVNVALIFWFSYSLAAPIIKLSKAAGEIADGNYEIPEVAVRTNDEVKVLAQSFNRMADSIRNQLVVIRKKAEVEGRLQEQEMQNLKMRSMLNEAQLKTLQAQINPHFMFNTLNAGMQLAMFEGAERTQAFMERLSELFRYNLGNLDKSATLTQEILNIDNYVYLLKERFADRITFIKQLAPDLPDVSMPRMILQPIVENSFIHGVGELESGGVIRLAASRKDKFVRVEIADNGPGIDRETLENILSQDYSDLTKEQESSSRAGSHSIGLRNVIERLMLYYNAGSVGQVIEIESGGGAGVRISLKLPLSHPEDV